MGLERSLRVIAEFPDRETTVPVMGQALREDAARYFALEWLLAAPEPRAAREIVRGWELLSAGARRHAREVAGSRILSAARQMLLADRAVTRRSVAEVIAGETARPEADLDDLLADLSQLVDDPDAATREVARGAFLDGLVHDPARLGGLLPHHPLLITLSVLLKDWSHHEDVRVVEALLGAGGGADEWLERAVGEEWPAAATIVETVGLPRDAAGAERRLALLGRWLAGPREPARRRAREILRSTENRELLAAAARTLSGPDEPDGLVWRKMRWWKLSDPDLAALSPETLRRIAAYLPGSEGDPEQRAERIARLLPLTEGATRRDVLGRLRGLPIEGVLPALAPILTGEDPEARVIAIELLPSAGAAALPWIVAQLASPHDEVRAAAARRLAGQGLQLWLDGRGRIPEAQRPAALSALRKVDPSFAGQIRRALASSTRDEIIAALQTVSELPEPGTFEDALVDLVVHPDPRVRATVTRALRRVSPETGVHYLKLLLDDEDARVVANAIEALGAMADTECDPWLRHATTHENARVRANAWLALGRRGDAAAPIALSQILEAGGEAGPSARWAIDRLGEGTDR